MTLSGPQCGELLFKGVPSGAKVREELLSFLESCVRGLCRSSDQVQIEIIEAGGKTLCVLIKCDESDLSLVIGRQGRNIRAIRELAWAIAAKHKFKATVIVNE